MRGILLKSLSRSAKCPVRPAATVLRREKATASTSTTASTESTESSEGATSSSISKKIPLLPVEMSGSAASMVRTRAQRITHRRQTTHLPHPDFAADIYTDEELYDTNRDVEKRMPLKNEKMFDTWRKRGLFKGDHDVMRTHYLDFESAWRGRVRGRQYYIWNRQTEEWEAKDRLGFFLARSLEKGHDVSGISQLVSLTAREAMSARPDQMIIHPEDLISEQVNKVLETDMELELTYDRGAWLGREKSSEAGWMPLEKEDSDKLNAALDSIVNWNQVQARLHDVSVSGAVNTSPLDLRIVGYRIYLPNISVRLVRNHTPNGQEYDPYIATFRLPTSMTKNDLRSYLKSVYDLDVTFIRTDVYWGKVVRDARGRKMRAKGFRHNYKRAVVGLHEPFHYPDDLRELRAIGRETGYGDKFYDSRVASLESSFNIQRQAEMRKAMLKRILYGPDHKRVEGSRGTVVRNIMLKKQAREDLIRGMAEKLRSDKEASKTQ